MQKGWRLFKISMNRQYRRMGKISMNRQYRSMGRIPSDGLQHRVQKEAVGEDSVEKEHQMIIYVVVVVVTWRQKMPHLLMVPLWYITTSTHGSIMVYYTTFTHRFITLEKTTAVCGFMPVANTTSSHDSVVIGETHTYPGFRQLRECYSYSWLINLKSYQRPLVC